MKLCQGHKSNQLFPLFQQCIYASLVKIPPLVQSIAKGNPILTFQGVGETLKIRPRSPESNHPTMYLCEFGQNPTTGSEVNARKPSFRHLKVEIRSRSPNSSQLSLLPTMHLCTFGQNPSTSSEDYTRKPYFGHFKVPHVTLKIRSILPKSNQLFPSSQQCIYASLVKIHRLVQKIVNGNESVRRRRRDPHHKQYIPHPPGWRT